MDMMPQKPVGVLLAKSPLAIARIEGIHTIHLRDEVSEVERAEERKVPGF